MWLLEQADSLLEPLCLRKLFAFLAIVVFCLVAIILQIDRQTFGPSNSEIHPMVYPSMKNGQKSVNQRVQPAMIKPPKPVRKRKPLPKPLRKICINMHGTWTRHIDFGLCPKFKNCQVILGTKEMDQCEAVIFDQIHLSKIPPPRKRGQIWIFLTHEPPSIAGGVYRNRKWKNVFNWTMSFRKDSDIHFPWGKILPVQHKTKLDYDKIYKEKEMDAGWIVSNCRTSSKRENFAEILRDYVSIDKYGRCSGFKCKASRTFADENDECRNYIIKRNKFYFSFENSLCKDYMTEKLFVFYKYRRPIIPVVRGALEANEILPKNTFINAADFTNARKLGKYLHDLSRDKDRYIAMLKEKDKYTAMTQNDTFMLALCSICDKMQSPSLVPSHVDLSKWIKKSGCRIPRDIR